LRVSAEIGHMDVRIILAALVVLLGILPCWAQSDSSGVPKQSGAWRIDSVQDAGSKEENFSLLTSAVGNKDATFSLWCKPDVPLYYFAIRDPHLAELPPGQETAVTVRLGDQEPVRFLAASAGGGSLVIQEIVHQTAFTLILASLRQRGAATVELSVANLQWVFSLDGFADSMQSLTEHCKFPPDPGRARQRR
jgi:hypothetical protein